MQTARIVASTRADMHSLGAVADGAKFESEVGQLAAFFNAVGEKGFAGASKDAFLHAGIVRDSARVGKWSDATCPHCG